MSKVKSQFIGQTVNYQNKKVVLSNNIDQSLADQLINSGLGRYFEGNPSPAKRERPVVKLEVIKKGANADAIIAGFNADPAKTVSVPYNKQKNEDLIALISKRGLELGEAKTKAELVAILEESDANA